MFPLSRRQMCLAARFCAAPLAAAFVASTLFAGCQSLTHPVREPDQTDAPPGNAATASTDKTPDTSASLLSVMRQGKWALRIAADGQTTGADAWRWRHPGLEDLLARPAAQRPDFRRWLDHQDPVVAGNAAIALARLHDLRAAEPLAATVRHPVLEMSMRRAAAEAFIPLGQPTASVALTNRARSADLVRELLAQYGDFRGRAHSRYLPELHAELVRSFSRLRPDEPAPLVDALESPAAIVRLEVLRSWPKTSSRPLPTEIAELCSDVNTQVRAAALRLVAAGRSPRTHDLLVRALGDLQLQVRLVAISGLGKLGGASSHVSLQQLLDREPATIRAAAVTALAEMDAWPEVYAAAEDSAWQVRRAVAASLRSETGPRAVALAERLLGDGSSQVCRQAVDTLSHWPLTKAGPLLLAGMETHSIVVRKAATAALAAHWRPARQFPYDAQPARRDQALAELRQNWLAKFGDARPSTPSARLDTPDITDIHATKPADLRRQIEAQVGQLSDRTTPTQVRKQLVQSLVEQGPLVVDVLESLVVSRQQVLPSEIYHRVLPELDPVFSTLLELESSSASERRHAAASLSNSTRGMALSDLALARLVELVTRQQDPLVWNSIETALAEDVRRPALELHYTAMSHPAPEVRRRACRYLAAHGDRAHQGVLLAALADDNPSVLRAAAEALAETGPLDHPEPLERLLSRRDPALRLVAGTSLAKLGLERGEAALERLARSDDPEIRRKTAAAMGEVGSSVFVPTLIDLFDDRLGVKRAALKSLAQIVGHDVAATESGVPASLSEQITRWRRWHARQ